MKDGLQPHDAYRKRTRPHRHTAWPRSRLPRANRSTSPLPSPLYNVQFEPVEADYAQALAYLGVKHKRRSLVVVFTDLVTLDAAKPLIAHMARLAQRHLPLCVVISDPNITNLAAQPPHSSDMVYQRAVAEMLLDERRVVLDTLNRSGVLTLDVPADKLTVSVINKYLELKGRGAI